MFTSAEWVLSLSCLLTSSLDSLHVCQGSAGLIKWQISVFFMRKSTAGHIYHLSGNNLILTFFGGDWKAVTWKKGKKGDKDVTSSVKDKLTDRVCLSSILIK